MPLFKRYVMELKIKLLKPLYINGSVIQADEVYLTNELHARALVSKGYAIYESEPQEDQSKKKMSKDEITEQTVTTEKTLSKKEK